MKVPVSFRMDPKLLDGIRKLKRKSGVPMTFIIEQAIKEYLRRGAKQ